MLVWEPNLNSITASVPIITEELFALSDPSVYTHPEFGILPEDAPCTDCMELIDRRTLKSRYYVQNGTNGNTIYSQTSFGKLHYLDSLGRLIPFDRRIKPLTDELFVAANQATPTYLNLDSKQTGFQINGDEFSFNNHLQLKHILPGGGFELLGNINWSNRTIGDHGIYITDAWPNIDVKITFELHMIKTNFIVKGPLGIEDGYLAISDQLILPDDYAVEFGEGEEGAIGWNGKLMVATTGEPAFGFEIDRALAYDSKEILFKDSVGIHAINPEYIYDSLNQNLIMTLPASWLNNPELIYPLIIDPLVTSTSIYGSLIKFRYLGEWCGGATFCEYTLDCVLPPNVTLTAATFSSQYITTNGACLGCWMSEAGFRMWSDSCTWYSPDAPQFWSCWMTDAPGTCTAINYDCFDLFSCLTPKCSGSIPIDMRTSYCYCNVFGTCPAGASVPCHTMAASSWSITLKGHNLETLGDAVDGNGSITYNDTYCCDDFLLDADPEYGVPPYTYLWSDATTGSTIIVSECVNGTYTYTCDVTDACGITRTATFTLVVDDCLLPITLSNFDCMPGEETIQLIWKTETEIDCAEFYIMRSADGIHFEEIGKLPCHGTTTSPQTYLFNDVQPFSGTNYYQLRQVDLFGQGETYSEVIACSMSDTKNVQEYYYNLMGEKVDFENASPGIYIREIVIDQIPFRQLILK